MAASTPANAMVEPTDKSMPSEMITYVMPKAKMAFMEICRSTFKIFRVVRKLLVPIDSTTTITNSTI